MHMWLTRDRIFAALVFLCWAMLMYPFPATVFMALCLACLCLPHYRWLSNYMSSRYAMTLVLLVATVCILLPIALVVIMVLPQAAHGMRILDQLRGRAGCKARKRRACLKPPTIMCA